MFTKRYHFNQSIKFTLIIALLLILISCSEDNTPTQSGSNTEAEKIYEEIVKPQEENFNLFKELTSSMDTLAAMDSVLKVILQDTLVDWGEAGDQGIFIQYKNGIRGGILIDPLDSPDNADLDPIRLDKVYSSNVNPQNIIPGSKKAIF
jgi:hypothetical protein